MPVPGGSGPYSVGEFYVPPVTPSAQVVAEEDGYAPPLIQAAWIMTMPKTFFLDDDFAKIVAGVSGLLRFRYDP